MPRPERTRRALLRGTALSGGASFVSACGLGGLGRAGGPAVKFGDPVTVTFWHTQQQPNVRTLEELATKFNQANGKNITLRLEYQGTFQQAHAKVLSAIQSGTPPDAAVGLDHQIFEWNRLGAVVDLSDYVDRGPSPLPKGSAEDIFAALLSGSRYETSGRRLASLPFARSVTALFLNEDLLAKAVGAGAKLSGVTFEDFRRNVAAASKKERDGRTVSVYGHHVKRDATLIDAWVLANGGEMLTRDQTKVRFNEGPAVEVFEMWGEMARAGQAYTSEGFNYQTDFGQGKVAGFHDTSAVRQVLRDEVKERFRWSISLLPQRDPAKPLTVTAGANVALIKSAALEQAATWEWLKFLTDRDQTALWSLRTGNLPVRKSAGDHAELKAHWEREPHGRQAFELLRYARPEPNLPAWQEIREPLQLALASVVAGRQSARSALDEATKQANRILEERR